MGEKNCKKCKHLGSGWVCMNEKSVYYGDSIGKIREIAKDLTGKDEYGCALFSSEKKEGELRVCVNCAHGLLVDAMVRCLINEDDVQYAMMGYGDTCDEFKSKPDNKDDANEFGTTDRYTKYGIECLEEMEHVFGIDAVIAFCKCNVWKYRYRNTCKEDEEKASNYMKKLIELESKKWKKE